jgi:hypothetical protein
VQKYAQKPPSKICSVSRALDYGKDAMPLTNYSKEQIAKWMLHRGHSFLVSAILIKRAGGSHDVELYNICQGAEVVLKSFLLFNNYDKYQPLLPKTKHFGHDLVKLSQAVIKDYGVKPLSTEETQELERLNKYYTNHYLRYAGAHDIFFPATDIEYGLTARKLLASIKLITRKLNL